MDKKQAEKRIKELRKVVEYHAKKYYDEDKPEITDLSGKRLTYVIYDKFEAEDNYADYMTRDTQGAIEISLSTCTDDSKARLIILAKANV